MSYTPSPSKSIKSDSGATSNGYQQTRFLGATILSWQTRLGWGTDASEVTVTVAEDTSTATKRAYNPFGITFFTTSQDSFNPPTLGSACMFRYGTFKFGGILENWEKNGGSNGFTYSVRLRSPSKVLSNSQVILSGLGSNSTGSTNLINLHKELGFADWCNDTGVTWAHIKNVIDGRVFQYYGNSLQLSIGSAVPASDLRFTGDVIDVLSALTRAASSQGKRIFLETVPNIQGTTIKVYSTTGSSSLARSVNSSGDIASGGVYRKFGSAVFGGNTGTSSSRVMSASAGIETNDITTAIGIIGDFEQVIVGNDNPIIKQYWGEDPETGEQFDVTSNTKLRGVNMGDSFDVNIGLQAFSKHLNGSTYNVTAGEILAAEESFDSWREFMAYFKADILGDFVGTNQGVGNFFVADATYALIAGGELDAEECDSVSLMNDAREYANFLRKLNKRESHLHQLHQFVANFASYFGQKWAVQIPEALCCGEENDVIAVNKSYEKSDGGWPTNENGSILGLSFRSAAMELFKTEDGKVGPILKFPAKDTDLSKLQGTWIKKSNSIYVQPGFEKIVADVNADPSLGRCDPEYAPWAILSAGGGVKVDNEAEGGDGQGDITFTDGLLYLIMMGENGGNALTEAQKKNIDELLNANFGGSSFRGLGLSKTVETPTGAVVPLKSNATRYGPWSAGGGASQSYGKSEFSVDSTFNPWTYGSFSAMTRAAQITAQSKVVSSRFSILESGQGKISGLPSDIGIVGLGRSLANAGANCTSINVNVGSGGVTTDIQFRTFVRNFGEIAQSRLEFFEMMAEKQHQFQRAFNLKSAQRAVNEQIKQFHNANTFGTPGGTLSTSSGAKASGLRNSLSGRSSAIIVGQNFKGSENMPQNFPSDAVYSRIMIAPLEVIVSEADSNESGFWDSTAGCSLDSIFTPFSIKEGSSSSSTSLLPSVGIDDEDKPDKNTFNAGNPFDLYQYIKLDSDLEKSSSSSSTDWKYNTNTTHVLRNQKCPKEGTRLTSTAPFKGARSIALRTPMVVSGWGYDRYGLPAPNSGEESNTVEETFVKNWSIDSREWKTGVLDLRWDEARKSWTCFNDPIDQPFYSPAHPFRLKIFPAKLKSEFSKSGVHWEAEAEVDMKWFANCHHQDTESRDVPDWIWWQFGKAGASDIYSKASVKIKACIPQDEEDTGAGSGSGDGGGGGSSTFFLPEETGFSYHWEDDAGTLQPDDPTGSDDATFEDGGPPSDKDEEEGFWEGVAKSYKEGDTVLVMWDSDTMKHPRFNQNPSEGSERDDRLGGWHETHFSNSLPTDTELDQKKDDNTGIKDSTFEKVFSGSKEKCEDYSGFDTTEINLPVVGFPAPKTEECPVPDEDRPYWPCHIYETFHGADGVDWADDLDHDFGYDNTKHQYLGHYAEGHSENEGDPAKVGVYWINQTDACPILRDDANRQIIDPDDPTSGDEASRKWGLNRPQPEEGDEGFSNAGPGGGIGRDEWPCFLWETLGGAKDIEWGKDPDGASREPGGMGWDDDEDQILIHKKNEVPKWDTAPGSCPIDDEALEAEWPCDIWKIYGGIAGMPADPDIKDRGYDEDFVQFVGHNEGDQLQFLNIDEFGDGVMFRFKEEKRVGSDAEPDNAGDLPVKIEDTLAGPKGFPDDHWDEDDEGNSLKPNQDFGFRKEPCDLETIVFARNNFGGAPIFQWVTAYGCGINFDASAVDQDAAPCHLWETYKGWDSIKYRKTGPNCDEVETSDCGFDPSRLQVLGHTGSDNADDVKIKWINVEDCFTEEADDAN